MYKINKINLYINVCTFTNVFLKSREMEVEFQSCFHYYLKLLNPFQKRDSKHSKENLFLTTKKKE